MSFWILKQLRSFILAIASKASPEQLASGVVLGLFLAFPLTNILYMIVMWTLILFLNVNIAMVLLSAVLFSLFSFVFDPASHALGIFFLEILPLDNFWVILSNLPVVPFLQFNNTVMLGGIVLALLLSFPVYKGAILLVIWFRRVVVAKIANLPVVKALKATKWVQRGMTWLG